METAAFENGTRLTGVFPTPALPFHQLLTAICKKWFWEWDNS